MDVLFLFQREYTGSWMASSDTPARFPRVDRFLLACCSSETQLSAIGGMSGKTYRGEQRSEFRDSGRDDPGPQVLGDLGHIFRLTQITPIIFVRAKPEYGFALGRKAKVGGNDREDAFFRDH